MTPPAGKVSAPHRGETLAAKGSRLGGRVGAWLDGAGYVWIGGLGLALLGIGGIWVSRTLPSDLVWHGWNTFGDPRGAAVLGLGIVLSVFEKVLGHGRTKRAEELEAELYDAKKTVAGMEQTAQTLRSELDAAQADYFQLWEKELEILANFVLQFGYGERISVYKHDGKAFILLGRYSKHPDYHATRGRAFYPDDQGCISRAWRGTDAYVAELPDPLKDKKGYLDAQAKLGIPKEVAAGMKMKSRSYAAFAIHDSDTQRPMAVVVFESVVPNLPNDHLTTVMSFEEKRLIHFLEKLRADEPRPSMAAERGF